jgi:glutamine synthetase
MTKDQILHSSPRLTRFCWVDNAGVSRGKAVWRAGLEAGLKAGVGLTVGQQALPMMFDAVVSESGLSAVGEARIMPDLETFMPLPFAPGSAMILGDMVSISGEPWAHCPRTFLKKQLLEAQKLGFEVFSSFENEFFLFNADDTPLDSSNYATLDAFESSRLVIDEIVDTLEAVGLTPEMYYPEAGTGQQEISVAPSVGVTAADRQVLFKTVVKSVAAKHKLKAAFAAKPILESTGSGCHLHVSLWQNGVNAFFDSGDPIKLSKLAYHAIAGVLEHLPALCALTVPSVNSYRRLQPGWWAGAFACYGLDNREASVRVASTHLLPNADANGKSTNFELKTCDASANPYIALGGLTAAMLDGIKRELEPGEPLQSAPATMTDDERAARGIVQLPLSLEQALANLERNDVLLKALGGLAKSFIAVRKAEAAYFAEHPDEELSRHRYVY